MRIVALKETERGSHESLFYQEGMEIPPGWVLIPEDTVYPDSFPFVHLSAEGTRVTAMEGLPLPPPESIPAPPTAHPDADMMEAILDQQVRLIQLELNDAPTK